jgi:hypothetical protein
VRAVSLLDERRVSGDLGWATSSGLFGGVTAGRGAGVQVQAPGAGKDVCRRARSQQTGGEEGVVCLAPAAIWSEAAHEDECARFPLAGCWLQKKESAPSNAQQC